MKRILKIILISVILATQSLAEDWPTYMHDNSRSGITREKLSLPLSLHWRISPPVVHKPAWPGPQKGHPGQKRLLFDNAFATVVVGDTVYFGSSVDNKIHAVDVTTGRGRWSFTTDGAVRLAPSVHGGKVYAGSDDGYAYCLNAKDGKLVWKVPLSLLWYGEPGSNTQQDTHLRGPAPLVIDGRVYVQCETILNVLKPDKNTQYVLCFDAYNGVEYWRRDVPGANRKYMKWYESNLAVDHDSLYVASKNKCFRFDGRTGELLATYETPPVAGTNSPLWSYVAVVDGILVGSVTTRSGVPLNNVGRGDIPELTRYLFSDALFAHEIKTGKQLWVHRGANIKKNATCIADGRVFLVDIGKMNDGRARAVWEAYLDSRQKTGKGGKPLQYVDKSTLPDLQDMDALAGGMGLDEDEDGLMLDEPPPPKPKENFDRFGKPVPHHLLAVCVPPEDRETAYSSRGPGQQTEARLALPARRVRDNLRLSRCYFRTSRQFQLCRSLVRQGSADSTTRNPTGMLDQHDPCRRAGGGNRGLLRLQMSLPSPGDDDLLSN